MRKFSFLFFALMGLTFIAQSCKNKAEGEAAAVGDAGEVAAAAGDKYTVDAANSILSWEAAKVTGKHNGTIGVVNGEFFLENGAITSGTFDIDMKSIVVLDLQPGKGKEDLEGHLKGSSKPEAADHFFNVTKYAEASFNVTNFMNE